MLEVKLFGKFDIRFNGKPVVISSRAGQSLFAYLILTAGTQHRREKLAGMFWPDVPEEKARAYLRHEVWRIRKALFQTSTVDYLVTDNLTIGFNLSSARWLDVAGLKNSSNVSSTEELIQALSSYQGELLSGFYEDWIVYEREHLQMLFEQKIACVLEQLEQEKRWDDILEWAERWISLNATAEDAYRALMVAYDALGDRAKLTSTYERCRQALRQLDLEPSEETRALAFKRISKIRVPIPLTSFIGREKEIKEVAALLAKSRLVTLTGSGGVGKTRLAIQVVAEVLDRFPDGVWFLDLAPLSDPALVPATFANIVGLRESGDLSAIELLKYFFQSRRSLVIFDNCEHLIDACSQLGHFLLTSCEHLLILATSREPLRVSGEIPYRVPSLTVPGYNIQFALTELANMESVRLFTERATLIAPEFVFNALNAFDIARICQRLDGIPLAIELAAARANLLSTQQILTGLDDRFHLLTHGLRSALQRHQTLSAAIDWSYNLLPAQEQLFFGRLSVFAGGWTLEAAESVCEGNGIEKREILDFLSELLNKSLILAESGQGLEMRYNMLETIRLYGRTKLSKKSEAQMMPQRHLAYFVELAERAEPNLRAFEMVTWLDRLEVDLDNIRTALEYALERNIESALALASALLWFWHIRGHTNECVGWLERGLSIETIERGNKPLQPDRALIRGKALRVAGFLNLMLTETGRAALFLEESLTLFQGLGTLGKQGRAYALLHLAEVAHNRLDLRGQKALLEESLALFQGIDDKFGLAECINVIGHYAVDDGDYEQARSLLEEHLTLRQTIGDRDGYALAHLALGYLAFHQGHYEQATVHYETSLTLFREVSNRGAVSMVLSGLGRVAQARGAYGRAITLLEESIALNQDLGDKFAVATGLHELGLVALSQGDYQRTIQTHEQALAIFREVGNPFLTATALRDLGVAAMAQGDYEQAIKKLEESLAISRETGDAFETAFVLHCMGRVAHFQADFESARKLNREAIMIFSELADPADMARGVARCLSFFAILAAVQKQMNRVACLFGASEKCYAPLRFEMSTAERDEQDRSIATTRATLGDEVFGEAWEEGNAMTLNEAMAYALQESW